MFRKSGKSSGNIFKGLNKNIIVLGVVSFFTDISSEMLYPVIPIFLTSVLGAPMSILGLIEGIAEGAASILKAFSGYVSDLSRRRKPFVVGGYFLSSAGKLLFYLAYAWPMVLLARLVDRFGKGLRTAPRDAMIADSCDPEYRGKAFGFHRAADTLGACLGPLAALWFIAGMKDNLRPIFLYAFVPAIIGVVLLIFFIKETIGRSLSSTGRLSIDKKAFTPEFRRFLIVSVVFSLGNSSDAFLIMRAKGLGLSTAMVILAYVLYNVSYSGLSLPAGMLADRMPKRGVMAAGYAIFSLVYIGFGIFSQKAAVWPLFFIYGFYMAMTDGVSKAMITDQVSKEARGTALGVYHCAVGLSVFAASLVAGFLWTHVGAEAAFIYGGIMSAISCVLLLVML